MVIPIIISLIISVFFVNFGSKNNLISLSLGKALEGNLSGKVLGESEFLKQPERDIGESGEKERINSQIVKAASGEYLNTIVNEVVKEVKNLPTIEMPGLPILGQPLEKLPSSKERSDERENKIVNFNLLADSGAALDCQNNNLIFSKKADEPKPIASITKLVTALTFLDYNPGWDKIYEIRPEDEREGGKANLFKGEKVKIKDLFYSSLVGSDNTATAALINAAGFTEEEFVFKMNEKIHKFGLKYTRFKDSVGLDNNNVSTASEVAQFSKIALANDEISRACLNKKYEFTTTGGRKKVIYNTNELLDSFREDGINILGGKTGYVEASGYCLVGKFINEAGKEIITVVLGAESDKARFSQTEELVKLVYQNFK